MQAFTSKLTPSRSQLITPDCRFSLSYDVLFSVGYGCFNGKGMFWPLSSDGGKWRDKAYDGSGRWSLQWKGEWMIHDKYRTAEWNCTFLNCCEGEEALFGERDIRNGKQRAIRHHKKTGHPVVFVISTTYEYGDIWNVWKLTQKGKDMKLHKSDKYFRCWNPG